MACSDTFSQMLEESDPLFRERNDYFLRLELAMREYGPLLCQWGDSIFAGETPQARKLSSVHRPIQNHYIEEVDAVAEEFGVTASDVRLELMVDASESLVRHLSSDGDGQAFFSWLNDHWNQDLRYLESRIERHKREIPHKRGTKKDKRIAALKVDEPAAKKLHDKLVWLSKKCASIS